MRAFQVRKFITPGDLRRRANILVQIDRAAARQQIQLRTALAQPRLHPLDIALHRQYRMIALRIDMGGHVHRRDQCVQQRLPCEVRAFVGKAGVDAQLALTRIDRFAEHREARRVRSALGHADQHRHHQFAEPFAQCRRLDQQAYNSTHSASPQKNSR
jgi:hypothetical protein